MWWGADLPVWRSLPDGVVLLHNGLGVVIHNDTKLLGPVLIGPNVCIGDAHVGDNRPPTIGSGVAIGVGAAILGPVLIGDGAVIGANAVVLRDVPPKHLAIGNPAHVRPI